MSICRCRAVPNPRHGGSAGPTVTRAWRASEGPVVARPRRDRRPDHRLRHGPDRPGQLGARSPDPVVAGRPSDGHHDLPAPHGPGRTGPDPQPPGQPDHLEAVEAALPLAREPARLRPGLHRRAHRQPRPRPVRRCQPCRRVRAGPLELPLGSGSPGDPGPVRPAGDRPDRALHQAAAARRLAQAPPAQPPGLDPWLGPRPPGWDRLGRSATDVRRQRGDRAGRGRLSLLGRQEGPPHVLHEPRSDGGRERPAVRPLPTAAGGPGSVPTAHVITSEVSR